jgi:hypothetical protein
MSSSNNSGNSHNFNKDEAIYNPAKKFATPNEIVDAKFLTKKEKLEALRNWELDIRLNEIAVEENMPAITGLRTADKPLISLSDVFDARDKLGVSYDGDHTPTNKLGMK